MKRIALILPYRAKFSPDNAGGLEIGVYYQNKDSSYQKGVTVFGPPHPNPYSQVSYHPINLSLPQRLLGTNRGYTKQIMSHCAQDLPDMIEVHNRANIFLAFATQFPSVPVTLYLHNEPQTMKLLRTAQERQQVLDKAAQIICCSEWVASRFCEGLSRGKERVSVVVNGVPRPWATPPLKEKLILFPNRLMREKGTLVFAKTVARLLPEFAAWRCVFVGLADQDILQELETILQPVRSQVEISDVKPYEEILGLFGRSSIVGVPVMLQEAFGRTAAEALAAGSALVSTSRGGLGDILKRAGLEVEPTEKSLENALGKLMADEAFLKTEQKRAWDRFDFTVEQSASQLHDLRETLFVQK